jgi:hypothetical protein
LKKPPSNPQMVSQPLVILGLKKEKKSHRKREESERKS